MTDFPQYVTSTLPPDPFPLMAQRHCICVLRHDARKEDEERHGAICHLREDTRVAWVRKMEFRVSGPETENCLLSPALLNQQ